MPKLADLRKKAKSLGIPAAEIRSASTVSELQELIDSYSKPKARKKSGGRPAKKSTIKPTGRKRGRPKGSTTRSKPARKSKPAPARSRGKAKRQTTARSASPSAYVPKGGRNLLDRVDYSKTDGWNPRDGSAPDRIVKALRKFKGNREKVFDLLVKDLWDFVGRKKANGTKRTKAEAEDYLHYRIARTDWDFAVRTGQHDIAENRVEYGTGGTGEGTFRKTGRKRGRPRKAEEAPKRRGRPPKAESARKPAAKRGRPAGRKTARKPAARRTRARR